MLSEVDEILYNLMNSLSLFLLLALILTSLPGPSIQLGDLLTKKPRLASEEPDISSNPIEKIFKSPNVELDRETLQPIEEVSIKNPESFKDRVLEVTTFIEGDLDPSDNIKVTTRIRDYKNEEITYITPSFEKIDGRLNYSHSVLQEENEGVFRIRGASKSDVDGEGSLGLHIQQFETEREEDNKQLFGKYAAFLQTYIQYLYKYNIDIKSEHLQDLKASFVYFGSLSNGKNPSLESSYTNDFSKQIDRKKSVYETVTGADGNEDSTISYGVSNETNKTGAHGFQNLVATAAGKEPLTGLQLRVMKDDMFIRGSIVGQALANTNNANSMTTVDAVGNNTGLGFTDNTTFSKENEEVLATATEINNLSVGDEVAKQENFIVLNSPSGGDGVGGSLPGVYRKEDVIIKDPK